MSTRNSDAKWLGCVGMSPHWILVAGALLIALAPTVAAQSVSGAITGTVVDQTDQVLPGVTVTLIDERTAASRSLITAETGEFHFAAVQPGVYTIRMELPGFSPYERRNTSVSATERVSLGVIKLSVGELSETVSVVGQGSLVQTQSSERSALITSNQLELLGARGRDVVSIFRTLPGVAIQQDPVSIGGAFGTTLPNIGGSRNGTTTVTIDGQMGNMTDGPQVFGSPISFDAIGEVQVQLNNYRAEYGRHGGAVINIVSKSGSKDYRGSAYGFRRHEALNANDYFNNRNGVPKPLYRYTTLGGALGGPVPFGALRRRLFFFYSFEHHSTRNPQPLRTVTVPTALERIGDFSQSREANANLIVIRDPQTGLPFPGNVIPAARINPNGRALLNVFPSPNQFDQNITRGAYNYTFQESLKAPKRQHLFRVDFERSSQDRFYVRGKTWYTGTGGYGSPAGGPNWGLLGLEYVHTDNGLLGNWTRVFGSSVVNEISGGGRLEHDWQNVLDPGELQRVTRSGIGFAVPQFEVQQNRLDLVPQAAFGGVPGSPASITWDGRTPADVRYTSYTFSDTLTWTRAKHVVKVGFDMLMSRIDNGPTAIFSGNFDFGRDANNPLDAGHAYANALLGGFRQYTESIGRVTGKVDSSVMNWFAQDTWQMAPRLTLDAGMRFVYFTHWAEPDGNAAAFSIERFDPSRTPRLYRPVFVGGTRMGQDSLTGQVVPAALIGAYVPGSGDPTNGMVLGTDASYPRGFREQEPVLFEPRVGLAYDLSGDGKTALRGSFGTFHAVQPSASFAGSALNNPPVQFNPVVFNADFNTIPQASRVQFPPNVQGADLGVRTPRLHSFTVGVQRNVGWNTILDVAYVRNQWRHQLNTRNINTVPYGARFLPQNQDPTRPGTPLPDNFFRPYPGYGTINHLCNCGKSNYDALQLSANRRFSQGFQFGVTYTLSQSKDYASTDTAALPLYQDPETWSWGLSSFDQTHVAVLNYTWNLPSPGSRWSNVFVRALLDGWILSGITTFASGFPSGVTLATTDGFDFTGGGDGTRVVVTGDSALPSGQRSLDNWFDTSVFRRPAPGEIGNGGKDVVRLPGIHNWDMTIFRNIRFRGNANRYVQFRLEAYNLFNQVQFMGVDTTARFDALGNQVNANFGRVTSVRTPRTLQLALRVNF